MLELFDMNFIQMFQVFLIQYSKNLNIYFVFLLGSDSFVLSIFSFFSFRNSKHRNKQRKTSSIFFRASTTNKTEHKL